MNTLKKEIKQNIVNILQRPIIYSVLTSQSMVVSGYLNVVKTVMNTTDRKYINNIRIEDLRKKNAFLVPIFHQNEEREIIVSGGFYFTINCNYKGYLGGVVINPKYRGQTPIRQLIKSTLNILFSMGVVNEFDLVVRQLPNGERNLKAIKLFKSLGFIELGIIRSPILDTYEDIHLHDSEESDGTICAVKMKLTSGEML